MVRLVSLTPIRPAPVTQSPAPDSLQLLFATPRAEEGTLRRDRAFSLEHNTPGGSASCAHSCSGLRTRPSCARRGRSPRRRLSVSQRDCAAHVRTSPHAIMGSQKLYLFCRWTKRGGESTGCRGWNCYHTARLTLMARLPASRRRLFFWKTETTLF